ncbi:MAG: hypothetical protein VX498_07695 [Myxococcota bacterium]|nr:hypothetical protein [Myxococcota bacterium]
MFGLLPSAFFAVVLLMEAAGAETRRIFWLLTLGGLCGAALLAGLTYWLLLTGYQLVIPNLLVRVKQPERFSPLSVLASNIALFVGLSSFAGILAIGLLENLSGGEDRLLNITFIPFLAAFCLLLFAGCAYLLSMAVLGPLVGIYRGLRAGVREVEVHRRTADLRDLPEDLQELLSAEGLQRTLGAPPTPAQPWDRMVWKYHVGSLGVVLAIVGALGLIASIPLCATLTDSSSGIPPSLAWLTPALSLLLIVAAAILDNIKPALGGHALRQLLDRTKVEALDPQDGGDEAEEGGRLLRLPGGAPLSWNETPGLELALYVADLPFTLEAVERATLDAENSDLDSGDESFDLATILEPTHNQSPALPWLTPDFRALLLALMHRGAYVRGGKVVLPLELSDRQALQLLDECLVLFDRLWALYSRLGDTAPDERALAALRATDDDSEREAIITELAAKGPSAATRAVLDCWAREGEGPSRLLALEPLYKIDGPAAAIVDDDESPELRAAALALWIERTVWSERATNPGLVDLLGSSGEAWLSQISTQETGITRLIQAVEEGDRALVEQLARLAVPLTENLGLARLEEQLDRCTPHAEVGPALVRLCRAWHMELTAERFSRWMRPAALEPKQQLHDWLEELGRSDFLRSDLKEAIEKARRFVWLQVERQREAQEQGQGALSLTEQGEGGKLSVAGGEGDLALTEDES